MSKHTPGPWIAGAGGTGRLVETKDGSIAIAMLNLAAPEDVATANARLITAAPDLLSALVSLEQAYANRHSPQHRAACLIEARAVIAKATP